MYYKSNSSRGKGSKDVNARQSRGNFLGKLPEQGKSKLTQAASINDGIKAWNKAPATIKQRKTLQTEKKFVITLPV